MLFNSGTFVVFFLAFLALYWLVRGSVAWRNRLIVAGSWLFYGAWDWRFLPLLIGSSLVDYWLGIAVEGSTGLARRRLLGLSVMTNLGLLGAFKYFNFFSDSLAAFITRLGGTPDWPTLNVVLPVGISFYTFQSLGYVLDVHRGRVPACRDLTRFLAFVAFFPQLVAGPIERAAHLLPQFASTRIITGQSLREGLWLVLMGLFRKVVIADNCGVVADLAFDQERYSGPGVVIGIVAFSLQIYGDFAGYSDIARGLSRLLGFNLMINFAEPYLARSLREFWQRWHVSLSEWLRDQVYIPLGGNRCGTARTVLNLFLTMLVGGLWHGAAWHFVAWGAWHGLGLAGRSLWQRGGFAVPRPFGWALTLVFVGLGWLLFRAPDLTTAALMARALGDGSAPVWWGSACIQLAWFGLPCMALDLATRARGNPEWGAGLRPVFRVALQGFLLFAVLRYWRLDSASFLYFQF